MKRRSLPASSRAVRGVTLIELMIALVLGLLVTAAAIGVFLSNKQTFRATEGLSRVQENARVGFELMAREVRVAGATACSREIPVVNVLKPSASYGLDWSTGVRGFDGDEAYSPVAFGSAGGDRVNGTDAIDLRSIHGGDVTVVDHKPKSAQFKVNTVFHGLQDGDIAMVCDYEQASIFQITNAQDGINTTVVHSTGGGVATPGNCSKGLGWADPVNCSTNGTPYTYGPNSTIVKLKATAWYIGVSGSDPARRSLYQLHLNRLSSGAPGTMRQEIAEGVVDMQLQYLLPGAADYVAASTLTATQWPEVSAVRAVLTLESGETVGIDADTLASERLTRTLAHVITLRNRIP